MIKLERYIFILLTVLFLSNCKREAEINYLSTVQKTGLIYNGIQFLSVDSNVSPRIIRSGFNYLNANFGENISFKIGLASVSLYYSTGDLKYLKLAKETADLLDSLLPMTGLVPEVSLDRRIKTKSLTYSGTWGQSNILAFVCAITEIDTNYRKLRDRLADALIRYCINPDNNLVYFQVNSLTGEPYCSEKIGYESQLGSTSCAVAQSLISASFDGPSKEKYLESALKILKSIWILRNKKNNLISECWDPYLYRNAKILYPCCEVFRYDDMGGAYVRALTIAYQASHDNEIKSILTSYLQALMKYVWDENINKGAFRYLTHTSYGAGNPELETMYGLFIASILEASVYVDNETKELILERCVKHSDHVFLTDYGVKNFMIPHNLSAGGVYNNKQNDSQLAYAVIQFPLGMSILSEKCGDYKYLRRTRQIIDTLLIRHQIGDNKKAPLGFVNILETQPPFGLEKDYYASDWCLSAMYLPAYMFYASIKSSNNTNINWFFDNKPCVFGLTEGMPFWDLKKVNIDQMAGRLALNDVTSISEGEIDFDYLGFNSISKCYCDSTPYFNFNAKKLSTMNGRHSYTIYFN